MIGNLKKATLSIAIALLIMCTVLFDVDLVGNVKKFIPSLPHFTYVENGEWKYVHSLSKDLTVYESYFDSRPRHNGFTNVTVLLLEVHRDVLDSGGIIGCGIDNVVALNFSIYSNFENKLMHDWLGPKPVIYESRLVMCYDLPARNGSKAFTLHKKVNTTKPIYLTYSRQPVFFPAAKVAPPSGENLTVVVCANAQNKNVPWLHEFIQYQKTIGVDHIDFNILDTFIKEGSYNDLILNSLPMRNALSDGFINFRVWRQTYEKEGEAFFHSASIRKLGCIYRHLRSYDYVMPLDTDDFFVPRGKLKKLKDYIYKYCHSKHAGSCRFDWIRYYMEHGLKGKTGCDGNVTAQINDTSHIEIGNYKSAHHTKAILDASFHAADCDECLMPGYVVAAVPQAAAYVAHLRFGDFNKKRTRN